MSTKKLRSHKNITPNFKPRSKNQNAEVFVLPPNILQKLGIDLGYIHNQENVKDTTSKSGLIESGNENEFLDTQLNGFESNSKSFSGNNKSSMIETANLMTESVLLSPTFISTTANIQGEIEISNNYDAEKSETSYSKLNTEHLAEDDSINLKHKNSMISESEISESTTIYEKSNTDNSSNIKNIVSTKEIVRDDHPDEAYLSDASNSNSENAEVSAGFSYSPSEITSTKNINIISEEILSAAQIKEIKKLHSPTANLIPISVNTIIKRIYQNDPDEVHSTNIDFTVEGMPHDLTVKKNCLSKCGYDFIIKDTDLLDNSTGNMSQIDGDVLIDRSRNSESSENSFVACLDIVVTDLEKHLEENEDLDKFINDINSNDAENIFNKIEDNDMDMSNTGNIQNESLDDNNYELRNVNKDNNNCFPFVEDVINGKSDEACLLQDKEIDINLDQTGIIEGTSIINQVICYEQRSLAVNSVNDINDQREIQNTVNDVKLIIYNNESSDIENSVTMDSIKTMENCVQYTDGELHNEQNSKPADILVDIEKMIDTKSNINHNTINNDYIHNSINDSALQNEMNKKIREIANYLSMSKKFSSSNLSNTEHHNNGHIYKKRTNSLALKSKICIQGVEKPGGKNDNHCSKKEVCTKVYKTYKRNKQIQDLQVVFKLNNECDEKRIILLKERDKSENNINVTNISPSSKSVQYCLCEDYGRLAYYDDDNVYEHIHFLEHECFSLHPSIIFDIYNEKHLIDRRDVEVEENMDCDINEVSGHICWNRIVNDGPENKDKDMSKESVSQGFVTVTSKPLGEEKTPEKGTLDEENSTVVCLTADKSTMDMQPNFEDKKMAIDDLKTADEGIATDIQPNLEDKKNDSDIPSSLTNDEELDTASPIARQNNVTSSPEIKVLKNIRNIDETSQNKDAVKNVNINDTAKDVDQEEIVELTEKNKFEKKRKRNSSVNVQDTSSASTSRKHTKYLDHEDSQSALFPEPVASKTTEPKKRGRKPKVSSNPQEHANEVLEFQDKALEPTEKSSKAGSEEDYEISNKQIKSGVSIERKISKRRSNRTLNETDLNISEENKSEACSPKDSKQVSAKIASENETTKTRRNIKTRKNNKNEDMANASTNNDNDSINDSLEKTPEKTDKGEHSAKIASRNETTKTGRNVKTAKNNKNDDMSNASINNDNNSSTKDTLEKTSEKTDKGKKRKRTSSRGSSKDGEPQAAKSIKCGVCHQLLSTTEWVEHTATEHCCIAWKEGETIDFKSKDLQEALRKVLKENGSLQCTFCSAKIKNTNKFLVHSEKCISSKITCGVCDEKLHEKDWLDHILKHDYLAWKAGETALNINDEEEIRRHLTETVKITGVLICRKCGLTRKYAKPYMHHVNTCTVRTSPPENAGNTDENTDDSEKKDEKNTSLHLKMKIEKIEHSDNDIITCAVCKEQHSFKAWKNHSMTKHYNIAWIVGDPPIDLKNPYDVEKYIKEYKEVYKKLVCNVCKISRVSNIGFYAHILTCGKTEEETDLFKNTCEKCNKKYLCIYQSQHYTWHREQEYKLSEKHTKELKHQVKKEEEVEVKGGKRKAAEKAKIVISKFEKEAGQYNYKCPKCNFGADHKSDLKGHRCDEQADFSDSDVSMKIQFEDSSDSSDVDSDVSKEAEEVEVTKRIRNSNATQGRERNKIPFTCDNPRDNSYLENSCIEFRNFFFTSDVLYPEWRAKCEELGDDELEKYLPPLEDSCKINVNQSNWTTLKRFESTRKKVHSLFVGACIQCMSWVPTTEDPKENNYLAVVTHNGTDTPTYRPDEIVQSHGLIQIWDFAHFGEPAKFVLGLVHTCGVVWSMSWCPSGGRDRDARLGLLAVATSAGAAYVFSVPYPTHTDKPKFYKLQPVAELRLRMMTDHKAYQATSVCWSQGRNHKFVVVGYGDGTVAQYDLTIDSPILRTEENGRRVLYPYTDERALEMSITAVSVFPSRYEHAGAVGGGAAGGGACGARGARLRGRAPSAHAAFSALWPALLLGGEDITTLAPLELDFLSHGRRFSSAAYASSLQHTNVACYTPPLVRTFKHHPIFGDPKKHVVCSLQMTRLGKKRKQLAKDDLATVIEPSTYDEAVTKYGIEFNLDKTAVMPKDRPLYSPRFPLADVPAMDFCPSAEHCKMLALGTHAGVVFVFST